MANEEETTEYNLRLNAAQMLSALAEVNSKAASVPEVLKNIENSLDAFSKKFGISFGAAEKEMQATIAQAEQLRKLLENPISAPLVINNANALAIAKASDPFEQIGLSQQAGIKALNDQRKEGILLAQQQAKSEAMVADEINLSVEAEQKVLSSQEREKILAQDIARINAEEATKKEAMLAASTAAPLPITEGLPEEYRASGDALQEYNQALLKDIDLSEIAANTTGQLTKAQLDLAIAEQETATKAEESSKVMVGGVDIVRRAVSFFIGQVLFSLLAGIQNLFASVIDNLKKLETAFFDLGVAEKAMSENGIAVTFQGLEAVVDRLHTKFQGLFSQNELTAAVANIAILTKGLGLTADQIEKIASTAATLQLEHPNQSIESISQILTTSDLNGRLTSLAKLGVNVDAIKKKEADLAAQLGISTKDLTEHQKAVIELEAAYETVAGDTGIVGDKLNSVSGLIQVAAASWEDFTVALGKAAAPLIERVLTFFIQQLTQATVWIDKNRDSLVLFSDVLGNVIVLFLKLAEVVLKFGTGAALAFQSAVEGANKLIAKIPFLKQLAESFGLHAPQDTPTAPVSPDTSANDANNANLIKAEQKTEDELNKIFTENRDKRIDIDTEYQRKLQDDALNNQQKLEDIATKEAQNVQDAYTNYDQKIQDIETSTAQKIQDAKKEAQQKEQQLTQKHYDNLVKLRNKYLMDLEDALHNRDARQILRLMEQYKNDQTAEDTSYKQEQQQIVKDEKLKIAQIERDKKIAEQAAKLELQRKLADIALAAARERQAQAINYARQQNDARIAYQRQLQDQQIYLQRKLRDLATAIQAEYNLTASGMAAIDALIGSYAGVGGAGGGTVGSNSTAGLSASSYTAATGVNAVLPQSQYNIYDTRFRSSLGLAEGGSFLATTPTKINVAENRPELITATPLGRPGQDVGKLFTQGGAGGGGGQLEVALTLSPDLEARVIRKSLDETANIVARINRSKV